MAINLKYEPSELLEHVELTLPWYYPESEINLVESEEKSAVLHLTRFSEPNELVEMRRGGRLDRAIEMVGGENIAIESKKSLAKGNSVTEYATTWD